MQSVFLTAEWRKLVLANYIVEPSMLEKYLPAHTELDFWEGRCYLSLVGFMFLDTRLLGFSVPFHRNFEEVNLRFYVRRRVAGEWRRGVVFIKEIVPRRAILLVANTLYGEHYVKLPMRHQWKTETGQRLQVAYEWKINGCWNKLSVEALPHPTSFAEGSGEEFITQHFWGYTKLGGGKTSEYEVEHPAWKFYPVKDFEIKVDGERMYGPPLGEILNKEPDSVFLAEGSEVVLRKGKLIR
ncbi:MAG: DUF2071 domain-containing protein [Bacteroidetes bacterium]|nr:DUF2071 domain-containing protein [Bacteroidota bacterium]